MLMLAIMVSTVMGLAAAIHFYWAFGGHYGLDSAGPRLEGGSFRPDVFGGMLPQFAFVVAILFV